jgi:hypothetical protein
MIESQPMTNDGPRGCKLPASMQRRNRVKKLAADAKQRRFALIGEAMTIEAALNAELRARILEILRRRVVSPKTYADIASVFDWGLS